MGALFVFLFVVGLYFVPSIVAVARHHNEAPVIIVNTLLGWTFIGWVVALAMAFGSEKPQTVIVQQVAPPATARFDPMTGEPLNPQARPVTHAPDTSPQIAAPPAADLPA